MASRASWRWRAGAGVALAGSLLAGCGILPPQGTAAVHPGTLVAPPNAQLTTVPVELGYVQKSAQVAGVVAPGQAALLYFHNGGTIAHLDMQVGQRVRRGQILASFSTSNDRYQIAQQELTIRSDQLAIAGLLKQDAVAAGTAAGASQQTAALEDARIQLEQDRIQLAEDELALREDEVVAPFSGIVSKVNNQVGDYVNGDQIIGEVDDDSTVRLVAKLSASQVQEVAPGDPVALALTSSTTNQVLDTTVASVQVPTAQQAAVAASNKALGALANPQVTLSAPPGFRPSASEVGVAFQAQITVASAQNVLYLPSDLIFSFNGLDFVNVDRGGVVTEQAVRLGLQGDSDTVILAGLKNGEQIVQP